MTNDGTARSRIARTAPVVAYAACGYGWAMAFFNYPSIWTSLTRIPPEAVRPAVRLFFATACAAMFAGAFLRDRALGIAAALAGAAAGAAFIAAAALPGPAPLYAAACVSGMAAGLSYSIGMLFIVHRVPGPFDARIVGACIASFCAIAGLMLALVASRGAVMALAIALPLGSAAAGLATRRCRAGELGEDEPLPLRPLLGLAYLVVLNYVAYNAATVTSVNGGTGFIAGMPALDWIFRAAVAMAAMAAIRRFNVVRMLYGSYIMIMAAMAFAIMGPAGRLPYGLLINAAFVLTEFGYASLLVRLGRGTRKQPVFFAVGTLAVALPSLAGNAIGAALASMLSDAPGIALGAGLALFCTALPFVPRLLRSTDAGFAASPTGGADGQESYVRDRLFARLDARTALDRLDSRYDEDYRLSPREREVAVLLLDRYDYDAIASRLGISTNTVKSHARSIYRKYDIRGRKDLIALSTSEEAG